MSFSQAEVERYARHLVLREIGGPGQQRLKAASVLMIGAGGLGAPAALYLAAAGVGRIGLADPDTVALSNLQRQVLYVAYDMAYGTQARAFVERARAAGARACDGLGMLVEQAAESFALWRGKRPPTAAILAELRAREAP